MSDNPTVQQAADVAAKTITALTVMDCEPCLATEGVNCIEIMNYPAIGAHVAEALAAGGLLADLHEGEHCQACGKPYGDVYWLPDHVWAEITPKREVQGAGLLCPSCALNRIIDAGLLAVPTPALTPEHADVIDAAEAWAELDRRTSPGGKRLAMRRLRAAVDRLAATEGQTQ